MTRAHALLLVGVLSAIACKRPEAHPASDAAPAIPAPTAEAKAEPAPATVDDVPITSDLTAFVVRRRAPSAAAPSPPMVFIPGMCVHPRDYLLTFRRAAAERGNLISVQGDISCGGNGYGRTWSNDLVAMDRRIEAAFAAASLPPPRDAVIIGYSMGADRAEALVARFPEKYRAAVLIASSNAPAPERLRRLKAVALMAGSLDGQSKMRAAAVPLRRAGVSAEFFEIPDARHGQMGSYSERTMATVLDFVSSPR